VNKLVTRSAKAVWKWRIGLAMYR